MTTPFLFEILFERRFDRAGARVIAGDGSLPRCGPVGAGVAPFDFPSLERSSAPDAAQAAAPPAPTFSEAELRDAVKAAAAEAASATEVEVRAALEAGVAERQAAALERIAADLAAHQAAFERWVAARAVASRDLALALARALVPRALERQPLADIEAMLRDLVIRLEDQSRLTLALPPALVEDGRQLLAELAAQAGYRGVLLVEPDRTLGAGDARLSWQGGSAERDLAELEREAIALVDAWLPETTAAPSPTERPDDSTDTAMP